MSDNSQDSPASAAEASDDSAAPAKDVVLVGDRVSETGGYRVLRQREDRIEVGELRALKQGQPLSGEVVQLHPTETHDRVFHCETLHEAEASGPRGPGPAQVATANYRQNWEQIFGALAERIDSDAPPDLPKDTSKLN